MITAEALHKKTPQEITALLYEACLNNLEDAIELIEQKEFMDANEKLQKANDILVRLGAGINYEAGIISDQLDVLYNYFADRLIEANYKKDVKIIKEVMDHLSKIASAWNEAMKKNKDKQPKTVKQKTNVYEQNVMYED